MSEPRTLKARMTDCYDIRLAIDLLPNDQPQERAAPQARVENTMTDAKIYDLAAKHAQYADANMLTLRGQGVIEFARDLLAERDKELHEGLDQIDAALKKVGA